MGRPKLEKPSPKCTAKNCRRVARIGSLCKKCHAQQEEKHAAKGNGHKKTVIDSETGVEIIPDQVTAMLTSEEAETWGRIFAEMQTQQQISQISALKQQQLQWQHERQIGILEQQRKQALDRANELRKHHEQLTRELCSKYETEPQYTIINVEERVIREEKPTA